MRELSPELRALHDLSRAASQGSAGVDDLLERICATVAETFSLERVVIFRHVPPDGLEPLAAQGIAVGEVPQGLRVSDQPLIARARETGDTAFSVDVADDKAITSDLVEEYAVTSALVVPLNAGGRCLGFLGADRNGRTFELEPAALGVLTTIGAFSGVFLERALEMSELRSLNDVARNFIGLASHELRTPAAVVHGIAATLQLRGDRLTDNQKHELRRTLYEQSDRLRILVDQLLDLSRLEAHAIEIRPRTFPVRRRVEEVLLMVAAERLSDVEVDIEPTLEAYTDPDAFDRVVSNLVTNAFRYGKPPVALEAELTESDFRLRVVDRGPGVAPSFVPKLFERFARSEASSASAIGSGLGLSIAQSYAQAQGGELAYRDAEPQGACFELVLPGLPPPV